MFDILCSSLGSKGHQQQQPCWNKVIPWLFATIYKKTTKKVLVKKREREKNENEEKIDARSI